MLKFSNTIALACIAAPLLIGACSKSDDKTTNTGAAIKETPADLRGAWLSPCMASAMPGLQGLQREYVFNAIGDFDKIERYFSDSKCQTLGATYKTIGTLDAKGPLADDKSVQSMNLTVNDAILTVNSEPVLTSFNTLKMCGRSDWAIGKEDSVIDANCVGALVKKGDVIFDVYSKNNEVLYFGQTSIFLVKDSGEDRPTAVNKDAPYAKK